MRHIHFFSIIVYLLSNRLLKSPYTPQGVLAAESPTSQVDNIVQVTDLLIDAYKGEIEELGFSDLQDSKGNKTISQEEKKKNLGNKKFHKELQITKFSLKEKNEFRLPYIGMTKEQMLIFKPLFETLYNGSWLYDGNSKSIFQIGGGLKDVFDKLDGLFPQIYLQCLKSNFESFGSKMNSQKELLSFFRDIIYNKDNIDLLKTKTIASFDWSPGYLNYRNLPISKIPKSKQSILTKIRHVFVYNPIDEDMNQCTEFGYVMEFRFNKMTKKLQYGFRIFMSYADVNNLSQCWDFYKPKTDKEIQWKDVFLSCKHMVNDFVKGDKF